MTQATHERGKPMRGPGMALVLGIAAVSSAAILISLARGEGVPALSIAALRMAFAAAVVVPVAVPGGTAGMRGLRPRDAVLAVVAGLFLALHFGFWTSSLDSTSVMSSVVFVSTNPLFVAVASALLFGERPRLGTFLGITVALVGGLAVGLLDATQSGAASVRGDVLAILGAVAASGYLLVGRRLRERMSLRLYVAIVYATAAAALLVAAAVAGAPLRLPSLRGLLWISLLAAGPQLLGHTSYNYALKYVSATFVTVTLLAEPVGATILAIPLLGQVPSPYRVVGGALILAGIGVAAWAETRGRKST